MDKKIKITKENYKDYIELYKRKDKIDKSTDRLSNILKIIECLLYSLGLGITIVANTVPLNLISIGLFFPSLVIYMYIVDVAANQVFKEIYQIGKNQKLKEMFPNIVTEIEKEELIDNLIRENIITRRYVRSGKYIKKGEYKITIQEERFLKYQNYLEQLNEQKEKEEKRKQRLIHKYNEIKKQMLDEYIRKPTNINCPLFVPEGELDKAKKQVKKLVKSRHNERKRILKKTFTI